MSIYVTVYDRQGREIQMPSIRRTAREMGVSEFTIRARLRDGGWIHRDGYVPVRVKVRSV